MSELNILDYFVTGIVVYLFWKTKNLSWKLNNILEVQNERLSEKSRGKK